MFGFALLWATLTKGGPYVDEGRCFSEVFCHYLGIPESRGPFLGVPMIRITIL